MGLAVPPVGEKKDLVFFVSFFFLFADNNTTAIILTNVENLFLLQI